MRIAVAVNGHARYVSSLDGAGFLSAHLNLYDRPKEKGRTGRFCIRGYETLETETISLSWPEFSVGTGDTLQLTILEDGDSDPPTERKSTTTAPQNLFASVELAKELLTLCSSFEGSLFALLEKSRGIEADEEHRKFKRAVASIAIHLGEDLLSPVYRRHPSLVPDELKGELL
jgi:hypothetical protein